MRSRCSFVHVSPPSLHVSLPSTWQAWNDQEGDACYLSRDLLQSLPSTAADIFSFGIMLYEIKSGEALPGAALTFLIWQPPSLYGNSRRPAWASPPLMITSPPLMITFTATHHHDRLRRPIGVPPTCPHMSHVSRPRGRLRRPMGVPSQWRRAIAARLRRRARFAHSSDDVAEA